LSKRVRVIQSGGRFHPLLFNEYRENFGGGWGL
jgi:hypothetical protein